MGNAAPFLSSLREGEHRGGLLSLNGDGNIGDEESGWLFLVLEFCDAPTRYQFTFLSKRHSQLLSSDASFKWRLTRLHIERGIYFPPKLPTGETWKRLYFSLYKRRELWDCDDERQGEDGRDIDAAAAAVGAAVTTENFKMTVCARFKPIRDDRDGKENEYERGATLPLHQRLALIKLTHRFDSNREALTVLKERGEWFKDKWSHIEKGTEGREEEPKEGREDDVDVPPQLACGVHEISTRPPRVIVVDPTKGLREFEFDHVFEATAEQDCVYESSTRRLVCDFINGFNASCFVYGQTGSGKTYTMFGPPSDVNHKINSSNHPFLDGQAQKGIVPRACDEILSAVAYRSSELNIPITASLFVSYVEIYGNEITDLLQNNRPCGHSKVASQRFVLEGASEVPVTSVREVQRLLRIGEGKKRRAATAMNERSTRAHSLFIMTLDQTRGGNGRRSGGADRGIGVVRRKSRLFLADLGGSEQTKKSRIHAGRSNHYEVLKKRTMGGQMIFENDDNDGGGDDDNSHRDTAATMAPPNEHRPEETTSDPPDNPYSTGFVQSDRMREAVNINLGLMSLKACVEALTSGNPDAYVPYANSKLTMLLSSGLGGDCKTSVIVCSSQKRRHVAETVAALKFGEACRDITKTARSLRNGGAALLRKLVRDIDDEIRECEAAIRRDERWEVREERRVDGLAESGTVESEGFGGVEVTKTTVLVGAENHRKRLDELISKKAVLTGVVNVDTSRKSNNQAKRKFGGDVGFGNAHEYGFGEQVRRDDVESNNYRFADKVNVEDLPTAVKTRAGEVGWKTADEIYEDEDRLSQRAKKADRNKLVYSGIST